MGLVGVAQVMRINRRWFGHVARKEATQLLQRALNFPVTGRKPCGRPRKTWRETIEEDTKTSGIIHMDPTDRKDWKAAIKEMKCPTPQSGTNGL